MHWQAVVQPACAYIGMSWNVGSYSLGACEGWWQQDTEALFYNLNSVNSVFSCHAIVKLYCTKVIPHNHNLWPSRNVWCVSVYRDPALCLYFHIFSVFCSVWEISVSIWRWVYSPQPITVCQVWGWDSIKMNWPYYNAVCVSLLCSWSFMYEELQVYVSVWPRAGSHTYTQAEQRGKQQTRWRYTCIHT